MKFIITAALLMLRINTFAAADPIDEQIMHSQAEDRKIVLVLGATPPEEKNFKYPGFSQDPFVVYFNTVHFRDIEHLRCAEADAEKYADWEKQFIQGDFNNLADLEAIQHRFGACFDLITLDFSVSKFMNFTGQHLQRFLGMLKIGCTMAFDHDTGCALVALKGNMPIASDEEALSICLEPLKPTEPTLMPKLFVRVNGRHPLSAKSSELLNEFYSQYVAGWKTIHMPDNCKLYVVENNIFPYWQATGHEDRDRWISKLRHYLVMRRLN